MFGFVIGQPTGVKKPGPTLRRCGKKNCPCSSRKDLPLNKQAAAAAKKKGGRR